MTTFLECKAIFLKDEKEVEKYENLGIEHSGQDEENYCVDLSLIKAWNSTDKGTTIRTIDGDAITILVPYDIFKEYMSYNNKIITYTKR